MKDTQQEVLLENKQSQLTKKLLQGINGIILVKVEWRKQSKY